MATTFATATHNGLVRRHNEDSYFARAPVFAVADGMGGAAAGEIASEMAVKSFEYFMPQSGSPQEELSKLIARINARIYEYASAGQGPAGMGTTLTAAVLAGKKLGIAHVGDSRAWLLREGRLQRLTEDHSLVAQLIREGQITEDEAASHPQRSIITRALGVDPGVEVDAQLIDWQEGDLFLLATDGLHGLVSEQDIEQILGRGSDLGEMANELIETANARGGNDNVTVVLFSPDGSLPGMEAGAAVPAVAVHKPARPRRRGALGLLNTIPGYILIGLLLSAVLVGGGWGVTRLFYYVGVEGESVTLYRGIPYELGPYSLSSRAQSSRVRFSTLEPFWQERINRLDIQSKSGAESMFRSIITADEERRAAEEEERRQQAEEARALNQPRSSESTGSGGTEDSPSADSSAAPSDGGN